SPELREVFERAGVTVLVNGDTLGAAESRNRGFVAGRGELVLFLDDDVVPEPTLLEAYLAAIRSDADASPGYVGVTRFPPPINSFTHGVHVSDMLTFFDIAAEREWLSWGVTANLCVRRSCVAGIPFDPVFPRSGGGEDVDFCLRLKEAAGKPFRSVPAAVVHHPWWNQGARSYRRFFRWAYGDSRLPVRHPRFRYLGFPTLPELCLVLLLTVPFLAWRGLAVQAALVAAGALAVEFVVDYVELRLRRPGTTLAASAEATLIRFANDLGRLWSHVRHFRFGGLLERFEYFATGESIGYERRVAGAKFLCWLGVGYVVLA
ncbi:MAG TPA: glycosyltransferase, partial [Longimicrobium sp.]